MRGMKDFLKDSVPAMVDYILVVSTPVSDSYGSHAGSATDRHDRLNVFNALRQRSNTLPVLYREAIPCLPYLLDVPRHLAEVTSAVIRTSKGQHQRHKPCELPVGLLDEFIAKCIEVEELALQRVSSLAARRSSRDDDRPSTPVRNQLSTSPVAARLRQLSISKSPPSTHRPYTSRNFSRPATAPASQSDLSDTLRYPEVLSDASLPSSPVSNSILVPSRLMTRPSQADMNSGQLTSSPEDKPSWSLQNIKRFNARSTSTDSIPSSSVKSPGSAPVAYKAVESQTDVSDDASKKNLKKGILRGILTRR